jgi:hypothetical protein
VGNKRSHNRFAGFLLFFGETVEQSRRSNRPNLPISRPEKSQGRRLMNGYRYNFLDENGMVEGGLVLHAESDQAACELASDLLARSECSFIEVRKGAGLIFQVTRGGLDSNRLQARMR